MAFKVEGNKLIYRNDSEILQLEPWGKNSLRIRGTKTAAVSQEPWALLEPEAYERLSDQNKPQKAYQRL